MESLCSAATATRKQKWWYTQKASDHNALNASTMKKWRYNETNENTWKQTIYSRDTQKGNTSNTTVERIFLHQQNASLYNRWSRCQKIRVPFVQNKIQNGTKGLGKIQPNAILPHRMPKNMNMYKELNKFNIKYQIRKKSIIDDYHRLELKTKTAKMHQLITKLKKYKRCIKCNKQTKASVLEKTTFCIQCAQKI